MKTLQFEISIDASPQKVWETMLDKETYVQWVDVAWPGSSYHGEWKKGASIRFTGDDGGGGTLARSPSSNRIRGSLPNTSPSCSTMAARIARAIWPRGGSAPPKPIPSPAKTVPPNSMSNSPRLQNGHRCSRTAGRRHLKPSSSSPSNKPEHRTEAPVPTPGLPVPRFCQRPPPPSFQEGCRSAPLVVGPALLRLRGED